MFNYEIGLSKAAPCKGFLVQEVIAYRWEEPCPCNQFKSTGAAPKQTDYWEHFSLFAEGETVVANDFDTKAVDFPDHTCGLMMMWNWVQFFCANLDGREWSPKHEYFQVPTHSPTGGATYIDGFERGGAPEANFAFSTKDEPRWWPLEKYKSVEDFNWTWAASWGCCKSGCGTMVVFAAEGPPLKALDVPDAQSITSWVQLPSCKTSNLRDLKRLKR